MRAGVQHPPPRSRSTATTTTTTVVVVAVLLAVTAAYHYTLMTLFSGLALDTPLAYLGLVPVLAVGLAVVVLRRPRPDHDIHDRQVDLLVGIPLLAAAVFVMLVLPQRLGSEFWLWRLDVLSLPLFAAGVVALLFGTRVMWRLRAPIGFLVVAWPLPWTALLERVDQPLLASTTNAVRGLTQLIPVASAYGEPGDGMFEVPTHTGSFVVTVASACAGASSTLGFLLLGSAATLVTRGRRSRKLLWLVTGLAVAWIANVLRILLLLVVGHRNGESVAIDVLHPVLGTVLFALTGVTMLLLLPRYGLALPARSDRQPRRPQPTGLASSGHWGRAALTLSLVAATTAVGLVNGTLSTNDQIVGPFGEPRLAAFSSSPARLTGWQVGDAGQYPQAARYFGDGATWHRLLYHSTQTLKGTDLGGLPVSIDAIGTRRRSALRAFSVQACYAFHRFEVSSHTQVDLGAGLQGEIFTYYNKRDHRDWSTLAWEWPVRNGATTEYERVVLILVDVRGVPVPSLSGSPVAGSEKASGAVRLAAERAFLRGFGHQLVQRLVSSAPAHGAST